MGPSSSTASPPHPHHAEAQGPGGPGSGLRCVPSCLGLYSQGASSARPRQDPLSVPDGSRTQGSVPAPQASWGLLAQLVARRQRLPRHDPGRPLPGWFIPRGLGLENLAQSEFPDSTPPPSSGDPRGCQGRSGGTTPAASLCPRRSCPHTRTLWSRTLPLYLRPVTDPR